jgi:preprotein translocase subunit SecE
LVTEQRTGPVTFVRQSISELRKVVWPTGAQLTQYFVVVLIFVLFMIALVSLLDFAFGWLLLKALG